MAKSSLIARLVCREGHTVQFEAELAALIEASNEEAGLEIYSVHRGPENVYWFFELYRDAAAVAAHGKGAAMAAVMKSSAQFLAAPPEIHRLTPVVAKGLTL